MTPTTSILTQANQQTTTTDRTGRSLTTRRLNALDKFRLLKAAGPILAENQPWLGVAMLAASVVAIDGVPLPWPANEQHIETLVGKLDEHGLDAVVEALAAAASSPEAASGN